MEDEYGIPLENFIKQRGSMTPWHFDPLLAFHDQPVIQNHFPYRPLDEWEKCGDGFKWEVESPLFIHAFFGQRLKQATKA